jgi:hypothetical protein
MGVIAQTQRAAITRWLFAPQPVYPLVVARIVFGAVFFCCYVVRLPDAEALYGPSGLGYAEWFQPFAKYPAITRAIAGAIESVLPAFSDGGMWVAYGALLISSFCFMVGFRTRTAGVITYLLSFYFVLGRLQAGYWGWPFVLHGFLLYVVVSPAGRFLSVDDWWARRKTGAAPRPASQWTTPAWPLRLLQVHVCTVYLTAGWSRIDDPGWLKGRGVYIAVTNMLHSKWVIDWQPYKLPLTFLSHFVFLLEMAAPVLLWVRSLTIVPYMLIAMHLGLEAISNVGWWSFIMLGGLASFLPTRHLEAVLERLPGGPRRDDGRVGDEETLDDPRHEYDLA